MYISIERNARGILDIEQYALNKMIEYTTNSVISKHIVNVDISTEIYHDNFLYVLVKLTLDEPNSISEVDETIIYKAIEQVISQTLDIKPKNIAIVYIR